MTQHPRDPKKVFAEWDAELDTELDALEREAVEQLARSLSDIPTLGKWIRTGQKLSNDATTGNLERGDKTRRIAAEEWQPMIDELVAKNPKLSWYQTTRKVAAKYKKSYKTIDKYCTDPREVGSSG